MRRRRYIGNHKRPILPQPSVRKEMHIQSHDPYIPNVRPFMKSNGYSEGLEEILQEIEGLSSRKNFYYEQGDLWRKRS